MKATLLPCVIERSAHRILCTHLALLALPVLHLSAAQRSFPGASGGGAEAIGGRGGSIFYVTTLADSGAGTLRAACSASGARTVVFRVGGLINLQSPIVIANPYITLAGQTAPGDGICITGDSLFTQTHNSIVRSMRFRANPATGELQYPLCLHNGSENIIFDTARLAGREAHMQSENATLWANGTAPGTVKKVTFKRCIFSEGIRDHSCGFIAGGANPYCRNISN